jgi:hypothetical protein
MITRPLRNRPCDTGRPRFDWRGQAGHHELGVVTGLELGRRSPAAALWRCCAPWLTFSIALPRGQFRRPRAKGVRTQNQPQDQPGAFPGHRKIPLTGKHLYHHK